MNTIVKPELMPVESYIFMIRRTHVMIDRDLAQLYNVETKGLNQAVKRNIARFPEQFRFQLTHLETIELVTNCDRFANLKHSTSLPYTFTEQGVAMLSAVLRSETAVKVSVQIMNAFVAMRKFLLANAQVFQRLDTLEIKQIQTDQKIDQILSALEHKSVQPKQGIFYEGQVFDAYQFVSDLIRSAEKSILLIDNYLDDTVLLHLSKRKPGVKVRLLTKTLSPPLALDIKKYNEQDTSSFEYLSEDDYKKWTRRVNLKKMIFYFLMKQDLERLQLYQKDFVVV
ncbi:ORF6N domain-containing protein [Deltaproteobacteria bacterium TL4]